MVRGRRPHELGPRTYRPKRSRWWKVDLRPWGGGRIVLRNPADPRWPRAGERTELETVAEAWKWAYYSRIQDQQWREAFGLSEPACPLEEVAAAYLQARAHQVSRSTWSADRTAVGHLLSRVPAGTTTDSLRPAMLAALFRELLEAGYKVSTLETYRISLRVFLASFGRPDLLDAVRLPSPGRTDVEVLGWEGIHRVREAASRMDADRSGRRGRFPSARLAVELGLSAGLRQGEIFALRWEDLRPSTHSVRIQYQVAKDERTPRPLKGKHARTALVLPGWWELHTGGLGLILGRETGPVGSRTQRNLIRRVLDSAGCARIGAGWHVLRHTYARLCLEEHGVSLEELQRFLGHASIRTTETVYGHFRPSVALERAVRKVYG